ncbi:MAG: hypothetical protein EA421_04635 [Gemmatimonadales bacterium]|nr:MAG: hypothetical protein EA421_04635 [Gemmatimonadales bacterium]
MGSDPEVKRGSRGGTPGKSGRRSFMETERAAAGSEAPREGQTKWGESTHHPRRVTWGNRP